MISNNSNWNIPFAHFGFDFEFVHFYTVFIRAMSFSMGKLVPGLGRTMERTTNLSIIFS